VVEAKALTHCPPPPRPSAGLLLADCHRDNGIGVLAYSPLMQGLLTGRWTDADSVPQYRARSRHFKGTRPLSRHGEQA